MKRVIQILLFVTIASSISLYLSSCKGDLAIDDGFAEGECTLLKCTNKFGEITFLYDSSGALVTQVFRDTSGGYTDTTHYIGGEFILDSIMQGNTRWVNTLENDKSTIRRFVGRGLFNKYIFETDNDNQRDFHFPTKVLEFEKSDDEPFKKITYENNGTNVTKMIIEEDRDRNGTYELRAEVMFEYDDGKNPFRKSPDRWKNPTGGSGWSLNNVTRMTYKDESGNESVTETTYEYNPFGYPTSVTQNGRTTKYEYDCPEF